MKLHEIFRLDEIKSAYIDFGYKNSDFAALHNYGQGFDPFVFDEEKAGHKVWAIKMVEEPSLRIKVDKRGGPNVGKFAVGVDETGNPSHVDVIFFENDQAGNLIKQYVIETIILKNNKRFNGKIVGYTRDHYELFKDDYIHAAQQIVIEYMRLNDEL